MNILQILTNNNYVMSVNSNFNELAEEVLYLQRLYQLLDIHPLVNGWYSWRIWSDWELQQIKLDLDGTTLAKNLSAKDIAILAIAISSGDERSDLAKIIDQERLIENEIVSLDDIIQNTKELISRMTTDHISNVTIVNNAVQNSAKIVILKKAYQKLSEYLRSHEEDLSNPEYMVLLGMVMTILGYRYEFRPYMINPNMEWIDWIEVFDWMFQDFNESSRQKYIEAWYYVAWEIFRSIRNEIFAKKARKSGTIQAKRFINQMRSLAIQSLPSVLSHPQGPQSPSLP